MEVSFFSCQLFIHTLGVIFSKKLLILKMSLFACTWCIIWVHFGNLHIFKQVYDRGYTSRMYIFFKLRNVHFLFTLIKCSLEEEWLIFIKNSWKLYFQFIEKCTFWKHHSKSTKINNYIVQITNNFSKTVGKKTIQIS